MREMYVDDNQEILDVLQQNNSFDEVIRDWSAGTDPQWSQMTAMHIAALKIISRLAATERYHQPHFWMAEAKNLLEFAAPLVFGWLDAGEMHRFKHTGGPDFRDTLVILYDLYTKLGGELPDEIRNRFDPPKPRRRKTRVVQLVACEICGTTTDLHTNEMCFK